jgi:hypothetical protein
VPSGGVSAWRAQTLKVEKMRDGEDSKGEYRAKIMFAFYSPFG